MHLWHLRLLGNSGLFFLQFPFTIFAGKKSCKEVYGFFFIYHCFCVIWAVCTSRIAFCSPNVITPIPTKATACVRCHTGEIPQILSFMEDQTMLSFSMCKAVRTENVKHVKYRGHSCSKTSLGVQVFPRCLIALQKGFLVIKLNKIIYRFIVWSQSCLQMNTTYSISMRTCSYPVLEDQAPVLTEIMGKSLHMLQNSSARQKVAATWFFSLDLRQEKRHHTDALKSQVSCSIDIKYFHLWRGLCLVCFQSHLREILALCTQSHAYLNSRSGCDVRSW